MFSDLWSPSANIKKRTTHCKYSIIVVWLRLGKQLDWGLQKVVVIVSKTNIDCLRRAQTFMSLAWKSLDPHSSHQPQTALALNAGIYCKSCMQNYPIWTSFLETGLDMYHSPNIEIDTINTIAILRRFIMSPHLMIGGMYLISHDKRTFV